MLTDQLRAELAPRGCKAPRRDQCKQSQRRTCGCMLWAAKGPSSALLGVLRSSPQYSPRDRLWVADGQCGGLGQKEESRQAG